MTPERLLLHGHSSYFYVAQEHFVIRHRGGLPPQLVRGGWTGLMAVTESGGQRRGGHHGEPTRVGMGVQLS